MIQKDRGDIIKDTIVKEYIGNPEIFADVFNFFLYDGEQKIKPENLTEKDVTELVTLPAAIKGQELSGEVDGSKCINVPSVKRMAVIQRRNTAIC